MHVRRLEMITQDLRYGWRLMVRKPAFTLVAVMTPRPRIGANVSMYSWLDGRLRHLLDGVEHADRIVALNTTLNGRADGNISRQHLRTCASTARTASRISSPTRSPH
jgi:putative ABC transport system permease protein